MAMEHASLLVFEEMGQMDSHHAAQYFELKACVFYRVIHSLKHILLAARVVEQKV